MYNALNIANYFLSLDDKKEYFNKNLVDLNGKKFYEGNARLNKIMHLAQNIYLAINDDKLISDDFYAYRNGAVVLPVQEGYVRLIDGKMNIPEISLPDEIKAFLHKIFLIFADAPIEELIDIDHEDPEWKRKHSDARTCKSEQKMDALAYVSDYKSRYKDIITLMNKMEIE